MILSECIDTTYLPLVLKVWEYFTTFAALCILLYVYCYIHFLILQTKMSFSLDLYIDTDPLKYPPCAPPFLYINRRSRIDLDIHNLNAFSDAGLSAGAIGGHIHNCVKSTLQDLRPCTLQNFVFYNYLQYIWFLNIRYSHQM